jgi:predicted AlkP superfamily phosphohydrolase/phosphomutase
VTRAAAALRCPNAATSSLTAAGLGVRGHRRPHHRGGGSHGSLVAGDSLVPILTLGVKGPAPVSIVDIAPTVLAHFGVAAPPYALRRAA